MKKYVSLIVCAVLMAIAIAVGAPAETEVVLGRGYGEDCKVNTIEQFSEVLDFFSDYRIKAAEENENNGFSGFAASVGNAEETVEDDEYTSATFYNKSRGTVDFSFSHDGSGSSTHVSFTRELTIYLTETAAYYKSVGAVMSNSSIRTDGESESVSGVMDFDFDMYMTAGSCYVKFNKFDVTASSEDDIADVITPVMMGKWFDVGEVGEYFLEINSENYAILESLGDYFEENKFSNFNQSNSVYTLKDERLTEAFTFIFGMDVPEDVRGSLKVNLSKKVKPMVTLVMSYNTSNYESGYSISASAYEENNMIFSNINNTIIGFSVKPGEIEKFPFNEEDM